MKGSDVSVSKTEAEEAMRCWADRFDHSPTPEGLIEIRVSTSVRCWSLGRQGASWTAAKEKSVEEHHDGQSGRAQIVTITTVSFVVTGTCDQSC